MAKTKSKLSEDEVWEKKKTLGRHLKHVATVTKNANDAISSERWAEARKWLNQMQDGAGDVGKELGDLIGASE